MVGREQSSGPGRRRRSAGGPAGRPGRSAAARAGLGPWARRQRRGLATHLLSGNRADVEAFFAAAEIYYRWPVLGWIDIPLWRRVRALLDDRAERPPRLPLDLATFGTPVLYGWNQAGYNRLLHFVFHRPVAGLPAYRAPFPLEPERIFRAADGDYVQQLGIAGTDVPPGLFRLAGTRGPIAAWGGCSRRACRFADRRSFAVRRARGRERHDAVGRLRDEPRSAGRSLRRPCGLCPAGMAAVPRPRNRPPLLSAGASPPPETVESAIGDGDRRSTRRRPGRIL